MNAQIAPAAPDTPPAANAAANAADAPTTVARTRSLGPLTMILEQAMSYPGKVMAAAAALLVTATSTLAVPYGFRMVIDKGFSTSTAFPASRQRIVFAQWKGWGVPT